ncbi:MAG: phage portal protein [Clostridia bacterium]|nr:phage portal protein [Clostridia bacterium]
MGIFKRKVKNEVEETKVDENQVDDILLKALMNGEEIGRNEALTIPAISSAIGLITDSFAMIPFKLYKKTIKDGEKQTTEVEDKRVSIINKETKDTLDGFQFKKAICEDYLLGKGGYAYINKKGNDFIGLNYIEQNKITILKNTDPIFKNFQLQINGENYKSFQFIKLLRNTKDGASGTGYITEINKTLQTAYKRIIYELALMKSNGTKKGFIKSQSRLDTKGMEELKKSWNDYVSGASSCVILNNGMEFQEASNTSVENQLNEKSKTFAEEVKEIFHIGKNNEDFIRHAVMPIAIGFATALNRDFLLEKEKESFYFAPDFTELAKTSIKDRYEAYHLAIGDGWMTRNEVRYKEDMDALEGLDMINLGLGDVLLDPKTKKIFIPNTNTTYPINEETNTSNSKKGGVNND